MLKAIVAQKLNPYQILVVDSSKSSLEGAIREDIQEREPLWEYSAWNGKAWQGLGAARSMSHGKARPGPEPNCVQSTPKTTALNRFAVMPREVGLTQVMSITHQVETKLANT